MKNLLNVLTAILFAACLKVDSSSNDGNPVDTEKVQNAAFELLSEYNFNSILPGEFQYIEKTIRVMTLEPQLRYQKGVTAIEVNPNSNVLTLGFQIKDPSEFDKPLILTREFGFGQQDLNSQKYEQAESFFSDFVAAKSKVESQQITESNSELVQIGPEMIYTLAMICKLKDINCYNFQVERSLESVPPLVLQRPNCGGIRNCQLQVVKFKMDVIFTDHNDKDNKTTKTKLLYRLKYSPDAPTLSRVLEQCTLSMISANGQQVPVDICYTTKDFKFGESPH